MSHMCTYARVCECVYAHVRARMNNEIAPFSGFSLSHYEDIPYIHAHSSNFSSCGTIFMFLCAHVMWRRVERLIVQFNHDCQSSLK